MNFDYHGRISEIINKSEYGTVFVSADFTDITDKKTVNVILERIASGGQLRRIIRGVYDKPLYNDFIDEYLVPSPDLVANALARNYGWSVVPCGDTALNLLGLSTQVPAAWTYVSDGPYKEYSFENTTIKFKRITNKEISKLSYKSALVVQALKALGKENVTDSVLLKLKNDLTADEKNKLLNETKSVTSWIYEYIKLICR